MKHVSGYLYWIVEIKERPGTFLEDSDISCHVYLVVLTVQLVMNSSNVSYVGI